MYEQYCDVVSLADFIIIAAEAVMGRTAKDYDAQDPFKDGTLLKDFRNNFKSGRETLE